MNIKLLNLIIKAENSLCIYRNYSFYGKFVRAVINIRILVEIAISFMFLFKYSDYCHCEPRTSIIYVLLANLNAILLIVLPWCNSNKFKILLFHLKHMHFYDFSITTFEAKEIKILLIVLVNSFIKLLLIIYNFATYSLCIIEVSPYYIYFIIIFFTVVDLRYELEYFAFSLLLIMVSDQLQSIINCIDKIKTAEDIKNPLNQIDNEELSDIKEIELKDIDKWSVVYTHITESSKLLNSIFGVQVIIYMNRKIIYINIFIRLYQTYPFFSVDYDVSNSYNILCGSYIFCSSRKYKGNYVQVICISFSDTRKF